MTDTRTATLGQRQVEAKMGQPIADYLFAAYNERGLSMREIAAETGVDPSTVHRWMKELRVTGIRHVGYRGRRT